MLCDPCAARALRAAAAKAPLELHRLLGQRRRIELRDNEVKGHNRAGTTT
jgi:hypothetical protein